MNETLLAANGFGDAERAGVKNELERMEALLAARFDPGRDGADEMDAYARDALLCGGKRLRPVLLCLAAGFGDAGERTRELMAAVEILHTASLIHDDIVDASPVRRGRPTLHALKGGHYAVQCGYYMIAAALDLLRDCRDRYVYEALAGVPMEMCLAELRQFEVEYDLSAQTEADYIKRIERKTARLIEGSCLAGARAAKLPKAFEDALRAFGLAFGLLFQLRDDLLDCDGATRDGKSAFRDMNRGIYTLPILYAAREAPSPALLALLAKREKTDAEMATLYESAKRAGGVAYTRRLMAAYADEALGALDALPDRGETRALRGIARSMNASPCPA